MFQDGSGGEPTDLPLTLGARRLTDPYPARGPGPLRDSGTRVERTRTARGRATRQRPRPGDVSTTTAYMLSERAPKHATEPPRRRAHDRPRAGRGSRRRRKCTLLAASRRQRAQSETNLSAPPATTRWAEFPGSTLRIHPFASMRFHVLLNSLFKVLFNFPSRYLSAIGLVPVFSLRWSLPPALGCIPKQPDSEAARRRRDQSHHGPDTRSG